MKPYDYIKQLLEMGTIEKVIVEYNDGIVEEYGIQDGDYMIHIEKFGRQEFDGRDLKNVKSITPIPRVQKLLPVGTKVRVFEEYKSKKADKTLVYTIYGMNFENYNLLISVSEDGEDIRLPARAVYPIWEREE